MLRAGFFLTALYILMSFSTSPYHVAIIRFCNGALTGFIPGGVALCASNTPRELTARYLAALQTASAAGTLIGPLIGGVLADLFGFRGGLLASGTMVGLAFVLVFVLVEERNKIVVTTRTSLFEDVKISLHHPVIFSTMVTVSLTAFATLSIQPVLSPYIESISHGSANWVNGAVFSLPGLAFLVTAGVWARLGERHGFEKLIPIGVFLSGLAAIMLSFAGTLPAFCVMYLVLGVFVAALRPSAAALVAQHVDQEFQGRAYAMQQSAFMFGGFAGPLAAGFISVMVGTRWLFSWMGVFLVIGAFILQRLIATWGAKKPATPAQPAAI